MTDLAIAEDEGIIRYWLDSGLSQAEALKSLGITKYRFERACRNLHISDDVRKQMAIHAHEQRAAHYRVNRKEELRVRVLELAAQDMSTYNIARQVHTHDKVVREILLEAGIDLAERSKRLRYLTRKPKDFPAHPHQCVRCGWIVSTVTIYQRYRLPYHYDDLCFPCWFEVTTGRAFQHEYIQNVKEVLRLAKQFRFAAIQTEYKGYNFRSRLEARWAVYFDSLRLRWEYEKEGYRLPSGGGYLPDFWLPELGAWVEIKGVPPNEEELRKAHDLAQGTRTPVYIFSGVPTLSWDESEWNPSYGWMASPEGYEEAGFVWVECGVCGSIGVVTMAQSRRMCGECKQGHLYEDFSRLRMARNAARSARFDGLGAKGKNRSRARARLTLN